MNAKHALLTALTSDAVAPVWRPFVSDCVALFMLHRFGDAELGVDGTSIAALRSTLAMLRRDGFPIVSFQDLAARDTPPKRHARPAVVFTIDDGYADFVRVAAPVFAEFDCPVTVFLTTGPIDRPSWLWWDRIEYAMRATKRTTVQLELGGRPVTWSWTSAQARDNAAAAVAEALKQVPNHEKESALAHLATRLEVELPAAPTSRYAAMTWSDVRQCAARGVSFGPHTVTHPMLTQVSESEVEWEIRESWRMVQERGGGATPIFCYPNGTFSPREAAIVARTGLAGAVTTESRYADRSVFQTRSGMARFAIPRFAFTENRPRLLSVLTGFERVNLALQEGRDGWRTVAAEDGARR